MNITRLAEEQFIQGITFMTRFPTVKHEAAILNTDLIQFQDFLGLSFRVFSENKIFLKKIQKTEENLSETFPFPGPPPHKNL